MSTEPDLPTDQAALTPSSAVIHKIDMLQGFIASITVLRSVRGGTQSFVHKSIHERSFS